MPNLKFYKTGTAPSDAQEGAVWFDSSKNAIKIKTVEGWSQYGLTNDTLYEANLKWGGKNYAGDFGPVDAALVPELGANRLAFLPHAAVTYEYSKDGGSTWTTVAEHSAEAVFSTGTRIYLGADSSTKVDKSKWLSRITVNSTNASL